MWDNRYIVFSNIVNLQTSKHVAGRQSEYYKCQIDNERWVGQQLFTGNCPELFWVAPDGFRWNEECTKD